MERIFELMLGLNIVDALIVFPESDFVISVYTYFPFTPHRCYETYPVSILRYIDGVPDREVKFDLLFPKKVKNMNRCEITVALFNSTPYLTVDHGTMVLSDFEGVLLHEISKYMNFSIRINFQKEGEDSRGNVFGNGSASGAIKKVRFTIAF